MNWLRFLSVTVIALGPVGCAQTESAGERASARRNEVEAVSDKRVIENIEYVPNASSRQKLDLYLPANSKSPVPVVLWIHGGGWSAGSKAKPAAVRLTERGYAVASIGYRLSDEAIFPAQAHDVNAALRWIRANDAKYNIDGTRVAVWGASAGGQLALLLGVGNNVAELEGEVETNPKDQLPIRCVIDYFGTVEFRKPKEFPLNNNRIKYLGGKSEDKPQLAALATPITHVTPDDAPVLIVHGDADKTVTISHSKALEESLKAAGVTVKFITVPGAGHGGDKFHTPEVNAEVDAFLDRYLRKN